MSHRKKKKAHKVFTKPKTYYINIAIFVFVVALIAFLTKIFIFDSNSTSNEKVKIEKSIQQPIAQNQPDIEHHKYEEKTKALEIEYINNEEDTTKNKPKLDLKIIKPEQPKFNFIDEKQALKTEETKTKITPKEEKIVEQKAEETKQKQEIVSKIKEVVPPKIVQKETQKETIVKKPTQVAEQIESSKSKKSTEQIVVQKDDKKSEEIPMLAIVIDDVSTKEQVNQIQDIGFPITMAFMPPTTTHKDSAKLAQNFDVHMIHLPLEASVRQHEEANTLYVGDSLETIDERIKQIRLWYPKTKYINNHTGSKFTEDDTSMDRLIQVIKKYDFVFIDSRTTPKTVAKKYTQKYGFRYIARNIFLDNTMTKKAVTEQLKQAISIAKKTGSAIAIGHPHNITLQALKESKSLLTGVKLVLIDKI